MKTITRDVMDVPRTASCSRLALFALAVVVGGAGCAEDDRPPLQIEPPASGEDVIVAMGHGRYLGTGLRALEPTPELFERTQRALLNRLIAAARADGIDVDGERPRTEQPDRFLANAALIDWLLDRARPGDHATIRSVNGAMRRAYAQTLPPGSAGAVTARVTFNSGEKYINECRDAGVPIPPPMYRTGEGNWVRRGSLTTNFLGGDAQLWEYRAPNGICLALPRYDSPSSGAKPFGIICLGTGAGTGTNKACFWDNPKGVPFPRDVEVPLTSFVGGHDLATNEQGVCTDCHAGANPFVVHPLDPAFATIAYADLPPRQWYEPIVHSDWPQNRGPSNLLDGVASEKKCTQCHAAIDEGGTAGQFPILSTELPQYCETILVQTAGTDLATAPRTMPPGLFEVDKYIPHRRALWEACRTRPDTGKIVTAPAPAPNPTFVSQPTLQAVAYDCANKVEVNHVVLGATVKLTVNGTSYSQVTENVSHIEFVLSAPLEIGDRITAVQTVGDVSSREATLTVRDHRLDYPDGIPAPAINPDLIYECADVIAVSHVPGALVTVFSSAGASSVSGWTSSGWTSFVPGTRPFVVGDTFRAQASLCPTEPPSPISPIATAVAAPSALPAPTFDPARAYNGQRLVSLSDLVNGARTKFQVAGAFAGELDVPISWWPNFNLSLALGRALRNGDTVSAQPRLCSEGPVTTIPVSKCGELPAPRIQTPLLPGATAVAIAIAQPGARIHVYDRSGTEIGNGGGTIIHLARALVAGDEIRVVQELDGCRSATAHLVAVRGQ